MASLEELMAGLFGGNVAPGAEDPRRRRGGGAGGGAELFSQFMPFLGGLPSYDYSGPGRGLAGMLNDRMGPAARHFQNLGVEPSQLPPGLAGQDQLPPGLAKRDELPPGLDNRNALGGANVAPGNIDSGQALFQSQGRALGRTQVPRTQGWLNVAPGYAIAAGRGYGTDAYGRGPVQQPGPGAQGGVRGGGGYGGPAKGGPGPGPGPASPTLPGAKPPALGSRGSYGDSGGGPAAAGGGGGYVGGGRPTPRRPNTRQLAARKGGPAGGGRRDAGGRPGGPSQRQVTNKKGGATGGSAPRNSLNTKPQADAGGRPGGPTNTQVAAAKSNEPTVRKTQTTSNNTPSETRPPSPPKAGKTKPKGGNTTGGQLR